VEPEDVVHVLRNLIEAVRLGGLVLDLQVIRPNPVVETGSERLSSVDGEPLFELADAATAAVEEAIRAGLLAEEAIDDHDVRKHYPAGADVIADFANKKRSIHDPERVRSCQQPCVVRERCRLRRLRVESG
jgi:hypothetical protein